MTTTEMTRSEYAKVLEAMTTKDIKVLAIRAAYGTVVKVSSMSRNYMIAFILNQKYFVEQ